MWMSQVCDSHEGDSHAGPSTLFLPFPNTKVFLASHKLFMSALASLDGLTGSACWVVFRKVDLRCSLLMATQHALPACPRLICDSRQLVTTWPAASAGRDSRKGRSSKCDAIATNSESM
jgi:hypothetical protein